MTNATGNLLLALAVIVVSATTMGRLAVRLGQPAVIGELVGGIILGPTVLGAFPGAIGDLAINDAIRPELHQIGELGVVLYLFLTGLTFDAPALGVKGKQCAAVAVGAFGLPFALAIPLALLIQPHHGVAQLGFVLFVATAMSVTALPVLARVLVERGAERSHTGTLALGAAAIQDTFGWTMLSISLASLVAGSLMGRLVNGVECMALLVGVWHGGTLITRQLNARNTSPSLAMAVGLAGMAICAAATNALGLSALIGAFVFGVTFGRGWDGSREMRATLEPVVLGLMLPIYFVLAGMAVNISALSADALWKLPAIVLVACVGKIGGTFAAASLTGVSTRDTRHLAIMMNIRGLMELIVLKVGLSAHVLNEELYTLFVIMALITTMSAAPLLAWFERRERSSSADDVPVWSRGGRSLAAMRPRL